MSFAWLTHESGPRHMVEAIRLIGTREREGVEHNPVILRWAKALPGGADLFKDDETPWCGLFAAWCYLMAGRDREIPVHWFRAREWAFTGGLCGGGQKFGDVLIFSRPGGAHVGFYVGEDKDSYFVLGGNQDNKVGVNRLLKARLIASRRPLYKLAPMNVRRIELARTGAPLSTSEA